MKLTEKQKILLFQLLAESCKFQDRGLFSLDLCERLSLSNQILDQQDKEPTSNVDRIFRDINPLYMRKNET
jgi:hypothetical protein